MKKIILLTILAFPFFTKVDAQCTATITPSGPLTFCEGDSVTLNGGATGSGPFLFSWSNGKGSSSIVVKTSGTYTLSITDGSACTATSAPVVVTVNPLPTITVNPSDTSICFGECVTLTVSGGTFYLWSNGQTSGGINTTITVCPFATTTYSVTGVDGNGCSNSAAATVRVNPFPAVSINPPASICIGSCVQLSASGGAVQCSWTPPICLNTPLSCNPISCCSTTVTYTVTVTDVNGCTNSASTTVTVNPLPIVTTCPDTTICLGGCADLCANGGAFYSWTPAACLFPPNVSNPKACCSTTTTYTVYVIDANGCQDSASTTVTVKQISPPPNVYCNGDTLSVDADPAYLLYQWYFNGSPIPGATDTFFVASLSGNYYVRITGLNGCSQNFSSPCGVGVFPINDRSIVSLYPNPVSSSFIIEVNNSSADLEMIIYNVLGKEMIRKKIISRRTEIERGNLVSGVYFVKMNAGERCWVENIMVE